MFRERIRNHNVETSQEESTSESNKRSVIKHCGFTRMVIALASIRMVNKSMIKKKQNKIAQGKKSNFEKIIHQIDQISQFSNLVLYVTKVVVAF